MLYLTTYDASTTSPASRRLRKTAQACKDYSQRTRPEVGLLVPRRSLWLGPSPRIARLQY